MSSYTEMYKRYLSLGDSLRQGDADLMERLEQVMTASRGGPINRGPVCFVDNLYCGSRQDVRDEDLMRRLRITHVLDCAASGTHSFRPTNISPQNYLTLEAADDEAFPIIKLFHHQAKAFLDAALREGGRVMVHCELGMNRSVTLCLSYQLHTHKCNLFQAVRDFSTARPNILTNRGFRRQLINFATQHNLI